MNRPVKIAAKGASVRAVLCWPFAGLLGAVGRRPLFIDGVRVTAKHNSWNGLGKLLTKGVKSPACGLYWPEVAVTSSSSGYLLFHGDSTHTRKNASAPALVSVPAPPC